MIFKRDPHRHLSSTTFKTGRIPLDASLGVGAPARDPSPKNSGPSGIWANCAASRTYAAPNQLRSMTDDSEHVR